jgi:hypothetical protein
MVIMVFVGVKTFLDHQMVLIPIICIIGFVLCFILLMKWNGERLRGS